MQQRFEQPLKAVAALALLCLAACAQMPPAASTQDMAATASAYDHRCTSLDKMLPYLLEQRHLAYVADAIGTDNIVSMWFVNTRNGDWAQLSLDNDTLQACIDHTGSDWHNAYGGS